MELIDHNAEGVVIQLDERELEVLLALEQQGRLATNHQEPTGHALDELLRTAAALVKQAQRSTAGRGRAY